MSDCGCLVESDLPVKVGDQLQLRLSFHESEPSMRMSWAAVCWVKGLQFGVEFIRIEEKGRARRNRYVSLLGGDPWARIYDWLRIGEGVSILSPHGSELTYPPYITHRSFARMMPGGIRLLCRSDKSRCPLLASSAVGSIVRVRGCADPARPAVTRLLEGRSPDFQWPAI